MASTTTREPALSKGIVPVNALKDQTTIGVYFEYIIGLAQVGDDRANVEFRNVSMFAADRHLLTKRHTANVTAPFSAPATMDTVEFQANFRDQSRSGLTGQLTHESAFLTVMEAWEFASQRNPVSHLITSATGGGTSYMTVAVSAIASEPLMFPIGEADTKAIRSDDDAASLGVVRKIARNAQDMWEAFSYDGKYARIENGWSATSVDATSGIGQLTTSLIERPAKDYPLYTPTPIAERLTRDLNPSLIALAHGDTQWS